MNEIFCWILGSVWAIGIGAFIGITVYYKMKHGIGFCGFIHTQASVTNERPLSDRPLSHVEYGSKK